MPYIYDKTKQPKESKYWHFRINDTSNEQFEKLKNLDCDWIRIGELEKNKVRQGYHYHAAIKFNRSLGIASVKPMVLYNLKLHDDDWYLGTKYTKSKGKGFMIYTIKQGIRYDSKPSIEEIEKKVEIKEEENKNIYSHLSTEQFDDLRLFKARMLDREWFQKYDRKFFNSNIFKNLWANCQHRSDLKNLFNKDNVYLHGDSGIGKSSLVDFLFPGCYRKLKSNEKWDDYSNYLKAHETVYFDEMDSLEEFDDCLGRFSEFKTITDVYPFPTRYNYGNSLIYIRPKRFFITSNFSISELMTTPNKFGRKPSNIEMLTKAFKRKFLQINEIGIIHEAIGCYFDKNIQRTVWVNDYYKNRWFNKPEEYGIIDFIKGNYPDKIDPFKNEKKISELIDEEFTESS